jgi:hypothetical protein
MISLKINSILFSVNIIHLLVNFFNAVFKHILKLFQVINYFYSEQK